MWFIRRMMKKLKWLIYLLFSWFFIHEIIIVNDGLNDNPIKSDYAVVFGTTVNVDGTLSDRLKSRLDKGMELYNNGMAPKIFVSGGLGIEGHYEGTKMADYLILKGVNKADILIDDKGNNTKLTVKNFVAKYPKSSRVIVVSQFYHISRAKLAFKNGGVNNVTAVHANQFFVRDLYGLFREFFGYYKY